MSAFDVIHDPLPAGFTAIEASAGTGKTWTISHLVVRLLLSDPELQPHQVLVVTFTNAATDELAARIRRVLLECRDGATDAARDLVAVVGGDCRPRIEHLLTRLDELGVSTIHAWCKRVLEGDAFASGEPFAADLAVDDGELIAAAVRDAWRARLWADARLAAVAAAQGWSVEADLAQWRRWNRHPDTRIEPELDLTAAIAAADAASAQVRAEAGDDALARLRSWRWKADYAPLLDGLLDALVRLRDGGEALDLAPALERLAADSVAAKGVFKAHVAAAQADTLLLACQALREALAGVRVAWLGWLCPAVRRQLEQAQARAAIRTQDDLLRRVRDGVRASPQLVATIRRRWRIALIDEFQDTDPVQWDIVRRCWGGGEHLLVVVGDPKQAIYRFRGADLDAYLGAVAGARRVRLGTNFRSDPLLVAAVQRLIGAATDPFLDPRIDLPAVDGREASSRLHGVDDAPLTVLLPPGEDGGLRREDAVVGGIQRLLRSGRIDDRAVVPRDCAVLVRSRNQALAMRDTLLSAGIPAAIAADGDVLAGETAAELVAVLQAVARPRDAHAVRAALATRLWGLDAPGIAALNADDAAWQRLCEDLERHLRTWQRHGLAVCVEELCAERASLPRLATLPDGERRLTDLRHTVEVLHAEAVAGNLRPAALLAWWSRRQDGAEADVRRLRLDSDASAVRVLTMHVSKGLEFPIVFCPYLGYRWDAPEDGALVADGDRHRLVLGGPALAEAEAAQQAEDDAEQLRLAYVALTRARLRCYVLWGRWDSMLKAPLLSSLGWWLRPDGQERDAWRGLAVDGDREERVQAIDDATQRLVDLADDGLAVRAADAPDGVWQASPPVDAGDGLRRLPADARARLDRHRRITSFTGLLAGGDDHERRADEPAAARPAAVAVPHGARALARGADVGDAWHKALEAWDFASDPSALVRQQLAAIGVDQPGGRNRGEGDPVAVVADVLRRLADLPLPDPDGPGLRLADAAQRIAEWEFHLPLAQVRPERVAQLIRAHADMPALRDAAPGGGFLRGFVDLLASDGERWWVIDWKTNHLGDAPDDYRPERVRQAMAEHGYVVQSLLYVLALHRFLRHRLGADYDYHRHVAGTAWIFLRGIDAGQGVCGWRPPLDLVEALDAELCP